MKILSILKRKIPMENAAHCSAFFLGLMKRTLIGLDCLNVRIYSVFHQFMQAEFAYGDLILSSSQFLQLPQRPLKMTLALKSGKNRLKKIISLLRSK